MMKLIPLFIIIAISFLVLETEAQIDSYNATYCDSFKNCSGCATTWSCNWCETEDKCVEGQFYGPKDKSTCNGWRWRQCKLSGLLFLILVGIGAGLGFILLVTLICCCCCKCCCKKKEPRYEVINAPIESEVFSSAQRTTRPSSDLERRREEMYEKYNIKRY